MTGTAPWSSQVATLPSNGFRHTHAVSLVVADGPTIALVPITSRITYAGRRTPRIDGTLEVAWPAKGTRDLMDPKRFRLSVQIDAGYLLGTGSARDVQRLVTLDVVEVVRDYLAHTVTLTVMSDEYVPVAHAAEVAYAYSVGDSVIDAIKALVAASFPGETLTWDYITGLDGRFAAAQRLEVGEDRWDTVQDWSDMIGVEVWHDGLGVWRITRMTAHAPPASAARLSVGVAGQVGRLEVADALTGYANRAVVRYEAKSGLTAATITVSGAIATTGQTRPRTVVIERKRKPDDPVSAARNALRRALRRGHTVTVTGTAFYWVRPGDAVTVAIPGEGQERLLVETVTFRLDAGTMDLTGQAITAASTDDITSTAF